MSGLHTDALATLRAWTPPTDGQATLRDRFVAHLAARPDGVWRSSYPEHVTAGTLVLSGDGTQVLLNLHRKARRWFHFGGHCEEGDRTLAGVALREALEESGLSGPDDLAFHPEPLHLDAHVVPFCGDRGEVTHLDVRYAALAHDGAVHQVSAESLDVRWWPVDALPDVEPAMTWFVHHARDVLC
ncbi:MAG TPA: NUDIX domain-containing protein [Nocardioides sp.]|nr:NUDIX domain-containing protein [Nocardioides sp.]